MGCTISRTQDENATEPYPFQTTEVFVFVPGLRLPKNLDTGTILQGRISSSLAERLSSTRAAIVVLATKYCFPTEKEKRRLTESGGSSLKELQSVLEGYLSLLRGFLKEGFHLSDIAEFSWGNQEDEIKETTLRSAQYELLSVIHLLGMLYLLEANITLTPKSLPDCHQPKASEVESKLRAIELLLKAAQILECGSDCILPRFPPNIKDKLPMDLQEGVLRGLQLQALCQGVEIQLGFAIENPKATLAVKRRLACEGFKCWKQAQENLSKVYLGSDWGIKHRLYVKWKCAEAMAAAYYYHGLILDESSEQNAHAKAMACLQQAQTSLKESQKNCFNFCASPPVTGYPTIWGPMLHLSEKIPKDALNKARARNQAYNNEVSYEPIPDVPDFPVALNPDPYEFPPIDDVWTQEANYIMQSPSVQTHFSVKHRVATQDAQRSTQERQHLRSFNSHDIPVKIFS